MRRLVRIGLLAALGLFVVLLAALPGETRAGDAPGLRLGLVTSLFRDTPKGMIQVLAQPMKILLETQTGMSGQVESNADAPTLAKLLQDKQLDLAVFHGFEFAWARQKYPDLQALVLVRNALPFQAYLVVPRESDCTDCAALKGKTLALPQRSREHLHLFLERRCACASKEAREFYRKITNPTDAEDALDDAADNLVDAALVDHAQLEAYRKAKPQGYAKLRILLKSETFPTGVIAYRPGVLSDETVQRIRAGLLSANQAEQGRNLLRLCKMAGFDLPPDDFNQALAAFARLYPPPPPR